MLNPRIGCYALDEPGEVCWPNLKEKFAAYNRFLTFKGMGMIATPEVVFGADCRQQADHFLPGKNIDPMHVPTITGANIHFTYIIQQSIPVPVEDRTLPGIRSGSVEGTKLR